MRQRLIAVVGETASGKSALALTIAPRVRGEIVNADSRQIYRGLDIGTAKPSAPEQAIVPHHLFDVAAPTDQYSLALFQRQARAAFSDIWSRGAIPWLVGGTGQYVWGLLEGWTVPEVAPDAGLRAELASYAGTMGAEALHARLAESDPVAAGRIDARNIRRVIRAIEVYAVSGTPISEWQRKGDPGFEFLVLAPNVPAAEIDRRIDDRVRAMVDAGFTHEVRALRAAGVTADDPAMASIGYREMLRWIEGESSLDQAIDECARATRRLARRQRQWFKRDDPRITWVADTEEAALAVALFLDRVGH